MAGVTMPQLQGNVNMGDLMKFRMGMIGTGQQLLPKVAAAAQQRTEHAQAMDEAGLGLKGLELGQRQQATAASMQSKQLDRASRIEAANIRAAGSAGDPMVKAMKGIEAEGQFQERMPLGAPDSAGRTPQAYGLTLSKAFPPSSVLQVAREIQDEQSAAGVSQMAKAETSDKFNADMLRRLAERHPEMAARLQQ